jgi:hypothetical protein
VHAALHEEPGGLVPLTPRHDTKVTRYKNKVTLKLKISPGIHVHAALDDDPGGLVSLGPSQGTHLLSLL